MINFRPTSSLLADWMLQLVQCLEYRLEKGGNIF